MTRQPSPAFGPRTVPPAHCGVEELGAGRPDPRHREQARFVALVVPHLDRALAFARRRTRSEADAEDIVQDACARAWLGFAGLRDDQCVLPWLYRILRSVLSDERDKRLRRQGLASISSLEDARDVCLADRAPGPHEELIDRITTEQVERALALIPEDYATAVELHDVVGLRYREVAEVTGVPIGTVMSRISRGRKLLAGVLATNAATWGLGAPVPAAVAVPRARGSGRWRWCR